MLFKFNLKSWKNQRSEGLFLETIYKEEELFHAVALQTRPLIINWINTSERIIIILTLTATVIMPHGYTKANQQDMVTQD